LVARLISRGARVDIVDEEGRSALFYAVRQCDETSIVKLLSVDRDVDRIDSQAYSAFHVAAGKGCVAGVNALLLAGAEINGLTVAGNTPLLLSLRSGHTDIARILIDHHADVSIQNKKGDTAIHYAVALGSEELLVQLLGQGSDPYRRNESGESAYSIAEQQYPGLVEVIRAKGGFRFPGF